MSLTYDDIYQGLLKFGTTPERARELAIDNCKAKGIPLPAAVVPKDNDTLERAEQHEVVKIFRAHGGVVYSLSQPRKTKQSPGLPDLLVFFRRQRLSFWFETKRPNGEGRQSPAQVVFQQHCEACGVRYHIGGQAEAYAIVAKLGASTFPPP